MFKGFVRVASAIPDLKVADCNYNAQQIVQQIHQAAKADVEVVCFPEMSLTGYTCGDLFFQSDLLKSAFDMLEYIVSETAAYTLIAIVGLPLQYKQRLYNVATVIQQGKILGFVPKINLPNNNEFYEKRWFETGRKISAESNFSFKKEAIPLGTNLLFSTGEYTFGIEICEDLWMPIPPSSQLALQGAELLFNPSASNEIIGKHNYRKQLVAQQSARTHTAYIYSSSGSGESTTDIVFTGNAIIAQNGTIVAESERFSFQPQLVINEVDVTLIRAERIRNPNFADDSNEATYRFITCQKTETHSEKLHKKIDKYPFVPPMENRTESCKEIFAIQTGGLAKRWLHTDSKTLIIGVSGGLDSTLALMVCVQTADKLNFDRKRIVGVTMPGFGTSARTYDNSIALMDALGITQMEISIKEACLQHFKDIDHDPNDHSVTYENTQARERTQILMDLSNKLSGMVVGTGDLSESALGWSTYNGDHMSMYGVNNGIPKTLVKYLIEYTITIFDTKTSEVLKDVIDTPISPELLPVDREGKIAQKTEDIVGPYELHDFFLYYFMRYGFSTEKIRFLSYQAFNEVYEKATIDKWLHTFIRRFFTQQFKRSCMPDGPKVGSVNLSPRGDWRMPSDAVPARWLDEIENR